MKAALAESQYGIDFNNRVTMPLNHRVVVLNGMLEEEEPETTASGGEAPTEVGLPLCSTITDPFEPCIPDGENVESGAVATMLAALWLLQIA